MCRFALDGPVPLSGNDGRLARRGFLEQCHLYEEQEVICHREEVLDKLRVVVNSVSRAGR